MEVNQWEKKQQLDKLLRYEKKVDRKFKQFLTLCRLGSNRYYLVTNNMFTATLFVK